MNTPQLKDTGLVIFGILMFVAVFMSLQRVDKYLKVKAIDDCGQVARYEYNGSDGSRSISPNDDVYKACMKDKGY